MEGCRIDYASFRSVEEEGINLGFKKRNDLLHIDAFPTRPTAGDLILRTFVNIHPTRPRVWLTSDPFSSLARRHDVPAGWPWIAAWSNVVRLLTRRTAYDRFVLHFHDYLKQKPRLPADLSESIAGNPFWSGVDCLHRYSSAIVPHAVLSGQYALEQTVIVSRHAPRSPACAPEEILKSLGSGRAL
jgi:hypothetical protein